MRKRYIFEIIAIALMFVIDQFTKYLVTTNMFLGQEIVIIKNFFSLNYLRNTGAGFSIMEGQMTYFYIITCIARMLVMEILTMRMCRAISTDISSAVAPRTSSTGRSTSAYWNRRTSHGWKRPCGHQPSSRRTAGTTSSSAATTYTRVR